jgi:RecB family exonuclease
VAKEKHLTGTVAGHDAYGFIDLIFRTGEGGVVVADLKTGRPKGTNGRNILKKGLFQLPFYSSLASQNGISPVTSACYIHLESSGRVTFEEISAEELLQIREDFEERVREIAWKIDQGQFPKRERKEFNARR